MHTHGSSFVRVSTVVSPSFPEPDFTILSRHIDPQWISLALASTGKASVRKRKLPAQQVVWLVIALALYRHQSMAQVVAELDLVLPDELNPYIATSALTQARQKLGQEPLEQLFVMCANAWDGRHQCGRSWRGLACYAIDGSTLRTPDTQDNRAHFGAQEYAAGVLSSYPQLRLLTLTSLSTHLLRGAVFGEYSKNEMRYAKELIDCIPEHSLTVLDKGFVSAKLLLQIQSGVTARQWLTAAKSNTKWTRLDEHPTDYHVQMKVSPQARKANSELPEYWQARAIETISKQGKRRILLTSLVDKKAWPAKEIALQYDRRWHVELSYRELKQEMLGGERTLRSGRPETIEQEVWGALLAYNLVRLEMAEVAKENGAEATDLSFTMALDYLQGEWRCLASSSSGTLPKHLQRLRQRLGDMLLSKQRRGRSCPRVVKLVPARYPVKKVRKP